jgi:hypothetical protein
MMIQVTTVEDMGKHLLESRVAERSQERNQVTCREPRQSMGQRGRWEAAGHTERPVRNVCCGNSLP